MFYATLRMDKDEVLHFKTDAASAMVAVGLFTAYLKGRYEGSGIGGEIIDVSIKPSRGVTYRSL